MTVRKAATIQEIARLAGVSTATVSRTLSNPDVVAEPTRNAVLNAVRDTGYRLNETARNLRRRRSGSVIALVPNLANPFFSQILSGISAVLTSAGYGLLVADTRTGPDPDARLTAYLTSGIADGLILLDGGLSAAALDARNRPPVMFACEWMDGSLPSVRVDNALGATLAVRHLAGMGHTAIGHLTGPRGNVLTETRLQGFRDGLDLCGLPPVPEFIVEGDFTLASGVAMAHRWLALERRPTALFCASDQMACGVIGALAQAGVAVPREISIVGFDDIEVAAHLNPPLTTIRQPRALIGERAARRLIEMIGGGTLSSPTEVVPIELISRSSVAAPS